MVFDGKVSIEICKRPETIIGFNVMPRRIVHPDPPLSLPGPAATRRQRHPCANHMPDSGGAYIRQDGASSPRWLPD
ncbi:MAG TPA: hypothetical protein VFQ54_09670, partial [Thermomicrobiales bacterium]|nr:hypothetical protein [Thermomicrobiales bacterium]